VESDPTSTNSASNGGNLDTFLQKQEEPATSKEHTINIDPFTALPHTQCSEHNQEGGFISSKQTMDSTKPSKSVHIILRLNTTSTDTHISLSDDSKPSTPRVSEVDDIISPNSIFAAPDRTSSAENKEEMISGESSSTSQESLFS
jgi:hypothetical protein